MATKKKNKKELEEILVDAGLSFAALLALKVVKAGFEEIAKSQEQKKPGTYIPYEEVK